MTDVDIRYPDLGNELWRTRRSSTTFSYSPGPPPLTFGFPVYTQAEIDAWNTDDPEYDRLVGRWVGSTTRTITSKGTAITTQTARNQVDADAVYAKCAAALWAADGNSARLAKVTEVLDSVKNVTSYSTQAGQDNLMAGWFVTNLCQAAAIIGYSDAGFSHFIGSVCYPMLDWWAAPNWQAVFADSRLAAAAYLEDPNKWDDALAYVNWSCPRGIYHEDYDGDSVVPLPSGSGNGWPGKLQNSPSASNTVAHWGGNWSVPQITTDLKAEYDGTPFPNGVDGERRRDYGHSVNTLAGYMQACRTMLATGVTPPTNILDRVAAMADNLGGRVLHHTNTGNDLAPAPLGPGGRSRFHGWWGVKRLLGGQTPQPVLDLLETSAVTTYVGSDGGNSADPVGGLHITADAFTNGDGA